MDHVRRRVLRFLAVANLARSAQLGAAVTAPSLNEEHFSVTVRRLIGDATPTTGRIEIGLPDVAESGNSVPLALRVESPMTATDRVRLIHVVAERNPRPWVASFTLGPRAGRAQVQTVIRLQDTQDVIAFAQMSDDSWWTQRVHVKVIIGACEALGTRH